MSVQMDLEETRGRTRFRALDDERGVGFGVSFVVEAVLGVEFGRGATEAAGLGLAPGSVRP